MIPDKNMTTYHTWYEDMPTSIKSNVDKIQYNKFWNKLCDGNENYRIMHLNEMNELYYSNPKNNLNKINLYGASSNYGIHKDCFFNFKGINFYRIIIGLTNRNDNIITYFNNFDVGHKLNYGDYIVFNFDKTTHQVIKEKEVLTPRIMLKLHFIVCHDYKYSKEYLELIKLCYLYYEFITRYIMKVGTEPETLYQFFLGLSAQFYMNNYTKYFIIFTILITLIVIKYLFKIKLIYKNTVKIIIYIFLTLLYIHLAIVILYWLRYKLFGIK